MKLTRKKKLLVLIPAMILAILSISLGISSAALADGNVQSNILKKAAYYQLYNCYSKSLNNSVSANSYNGVGALFSNDNKYPLPYGFTGINSSSTAGDMITCTQLINGTTGFDGLAKYAKDYGQDVPSEIPPSSGADLGTLSPFMAGMGYIVTTTTSGSDAKNVCARYTWSATYSGVDAIHYKPRDIWVELCVPELKNGKIASDKLTVKYSDEKKGAEVVKIEAVDHKIRVFCGEVTAWSTTRAWCTDHSFNSDTDWNEFENEVRKEIAFRAGKKEVMVAQGVTATYEYKLSDSGNNNNNTYTAFNIKDGNETLSAISAIKYLSNQNFSSSLSGAAKTLALTTEEKAVLTQKLLENHYGINQGSNGQDGGVVCGVAENSSNATSLTSWGYKKMNYYVNGHLQKDCYVKAVKNGGTGVYFYNSRGFFDGVTIKYFDGLVQEMNSFTLETLSDAGAMDDGPQDAGTDDDEDGTQYLCTTAGGPLSWILCPALSLIGTTVEWLYDWIEQQFLGIESGFYSSGSATYNSWKTFQGYANIFFIILLVLVIISQVTGFGISNYGIKKTLPKLIIAIILINISFFLCQIAVDLSNIIGETVKKTFDGMAKMEGVESGTGLWKQVVNTFTLIGGGAEIGGAIAAGFVALKLSPELFTAWMPMIILTLIGVVIGVIFFFIILCVRQAAVVVLIVLAPLAVAAYALPNTKKLFDRWFKLFVALLLVYPICGVMMGGGNFVSALLIQSAGDGNGGFGTVLIGLLANIIPFFLIPSILRSSMSAMGNLGAKITGFGDRMSRGIGRGVIGSESFKEHQRQGVKARNQARVDRLSSNAGTRQRLARGLRRIGWTGSADALERSSERDLARSASVYKKMQMEDNEREMLARNASPESIADSIAAARATAERKHVDEEINNGANLMASGNVSYIGEDGAEQNINADDVGSLNAAQEYFMMQAHNATDESTKQFYTRRAQSAQQLLFAKGDTGRTESAKSLYDHVFGDGTPGSAHGKSDIAKALASRISADGKWMADLKNEDPGMFALVNDLVGNKEKLGSRISYELPKPEKFSAGAVPKLSDNFFANIEKNMDELKKEGNADLVSEYSRIFTRAMSDERISKDLKGKKDAMRVMNAIRELDYKNNLKNYAKAKGITDKNEARKDFEEDYGKYKELKVGESHKIPHPKIKTPGDWRRNAADKGRWYEYDKHNQPVRALNIEEIKMANAIENKNIEHKVQDIENNT